MEQAFPSDLSHQQWKFIKPLLPKARKGGRPRSTNLRHVINAILYVNRTGIPWRYLPNCFPPWQTVYDYFWKWSRRGIWRKINLKLLVCVRTHENRRAYPRLAIVDSQSIRAHFGEKRAKDCFKKLMGRKRSVLVDSLGFVFECYVHKGNDQDFYGLMTLIHRLDASISDGLEVILGDMGYRMSTLREEVESRGIEMRVLDRKKQGTNMKPKRWIVERSFAWLNHFRRHSRDYEKRTHASESMIFISTTQLLLKRLSDFCRWLLATFQTPSCGGTVRQQRSAQ